MQQIQRKRERGRLARPPSYYYIIQPLTRACERSGSGRISAHRSNLFLWLPIPAPFPALRPPAPANFFHTRSPLRSRSLDFWPAPLQFRSTPAAICFKQQTEKWTNFYRASSYDNAVLAIVIKCVCLSVRLSATHVLCDITKQYTADILMPHERAITLVIWHQQWLQGWWATVLPCPCRRCEHANTQRRPACSLLGAMPESKSFCVRLKHNFWILINGAKFSICSRYQVLSKYFCFILSPLEWNGYCPVAATGHVRACLAIRSPRPDESGKG